MGKNNASIPDLQTLIMAGIDPKTRLPIKMTSSNKARLKSDTKMFLRLVDEQDAVNRYKWYNLPANLTSQEVERMLYYKGQLCFFYFEELDMFFFMPYALSGKEGTGIDFYGRFREVHPVPMANGAEDEKSERYAKQMALLSMKNLKCVYGMKLPEELTEEDFTKSCVLLHDYTKQLSQTIIPRSQVNEPLLDVMSECIPFMRTSLLLSTGVRGVKISDADQSESVIDASRSLENAALVGDPYVPIIGSPVEMQELTDGAVGKSEEYMLALQSLDNLRLSGYGIDNGGLFEKKAHELQSEADINGGPVGLVLQDGLDIRQNFCNIVNSIWDLGIWCEPAQNIMGVDLDGDGAIYDDDMSGQHTGVDTKEDSSNE